MCNVYLKDVLKLSSGIKLRNRTNSKLLLYFLLYANTIILNKFHKFLLILL